MEAEGLCASSVQLSLDWPRKGWNLRSGNFLPLGVTPQGGTWLWAISFYFQQLGLWGSESLCAEGTAGRRPQHPLPVAVLSELGKSWGPETKAYFSRDQLILERELQRWGWTEKMGRALRAWRDMRSLLQPHNSMSDSTQKQREVQPPCMVTLYPEDVLIEVISYCQLRSGFLWLSFSPLPNQAFFTLSPTCSQQTEDMLNLIFL